MSDKTLTFDTNESGQVIRPRLHDGRVAGLMAGDGGAQVLLEDLEKRHYSLRLNALEKLVANDFREGNIILDVVVRPCRSDDGNVVARLFGLRPADRNADLVVKLVERAVAEGALIVEVNPSYGCSLLALCKQVRMTADDW